MAYHKSAWLKKDTSELLNKAKSKIYNENPNIKNVSDDKAINTGLKFYLEDKTK